MPEPDANTRAVTKAVDEAVSAYFEAEYGSTSMPAGWVLLVNSIGTDMETEPSGVVSIYPNGSMPWATALGIVEMGRIEMHHVFATTGGNEG